MADRPTKTAGTTNYTSEVAAGATTIKATEVDGDFNQIFTNITDKNVAVGAAIATAKIAADGGINTGYLSTGAVTTPILFGLAVTTPKIAAGASVNGAVVSATIVAFTQGAGGESQVVALPSISTRGGRVIVFGTVAGFMTTSTTASSTATFKLFRDGVQIPNALWTIDMQSEVSTLRSVPAAFPTLWTEVPSGTPSVPVAHVYSLRCAVASTGTAIFQSDASNGGILFAVEFA